MNTNYEPIISKISENVKLLIKHNIQLKKRNTDLEQANESLQHILEQKEKEIEILEKNCERLKIAEVIIKGSGSNKEAKTKISRIVREIDKCIALLNK